MQGRADYNEPTSAIARERVQYHDDPLNLSRYRLDRGPVDQTISRCNRVDNCWKFLANMRIVVARLLPGTGHFE